MERRGSRGLRETLNEHFPQQNQFVSFPQGSSLIYLDAYHIIDGHRENVKYTNKHSFQIRNFTVSGNFKVKTH